MFIKNILIYIYRSSNIRNQIRVTMILTRKLFAPDQMQHAVQTDSIASSILLHQFARIESDAFTPPLDSIRFLQQTRFHFSTEKLDTRNPSNDSALYLKRFFGKEILLIIDNSYAVSITYRHSRHLTINAFVQKKKKNLSHLYKMISSITAVISGMHEPKGTRQSGKSGGNR